LLLCNATVGIRDVTPGSNADAHDERFLEMITNLLNWLLGAWGGVSAGSSGYQIPPGTLPFGS